MEYNFDGPVHESFPVPSVFLITPGAGEENTLVADKIDSLNRSSNSSVLKRNRSSRSIDQVEAVGGNIGGNEDYTGSMEAWSSDTHAVSINDPFATHSSSFPSMLPGAMIQETQRSSAVLGGGVFKRRKVNTKPKTLIDDDTNDIIAATATVSNADYDSLQSSSSSSSFSFSSRLVDNRRFQQNSTKLFSNDYDSQLEACIFFRTILASSLKHLSATMLNNGTVSRIIQLLKTTQDDKLRFELLWSITNIACEKEHHVRVLFDEGCIEILLDMIVTGKQQHAEQAIWALGNVVANHSSSIKLLCESNMLELVLWRTGLDETQPIAAAPSLETMQHCCWVLHSFSRSFGSVKLTAAIENKFNALMQGLSVLIHSPDYELLGDACMVVYELCNNCTLCVQQLLRLGMVSRLVKLASPPYMVNNIKRPAPQQNEPVPVRYASIKALASMLRVCTHMQSLGLLLPKYALLEKLISELLDKKVDNCQYKAEILLALAATAGRNSKYSERFVSIEPLLQGLYDMVSNENENEVLFKEASRFIAIMVLNSRRNHMNVPGGNYVLSLVYKILETTMVRMLKANDMDIKIVALRVLEVVFNNSYYGPMLHSNAIIMEEMEDIVGALALDPSVSIAEAAKYIDEKWTGCSGSSS